MTTDKDGNGITVDHWDVITSTFDGGVVWRRYRDRKIVTASRDESPDSALARQERERADRKRGRD